MTSADEAPGGLEPVRALLNTWYVPNDTRVPTDLLDALRRDPPEWAARVDLPRPRTRVDLARLAEVRDGLRRLVEREEPAETGLRWLRQAFAAHPTTPAVDLAGAELSLRLVAADPRDPTSVVMGAVAEAVRTGAWHRLKACPDCRWVFHDHSRSGTRVWCGMTATGPNGRACGSIAKVRTYRQRQAGNPA
ncbi:CGNR zinc finger domain-containing protein [Actinosynnema sp. NPDC020468]|uniref:CGNR zinc finger domain-containing protein n=1 Tax=Actinosynnema sp. NPDC020468 TaxID=3154488 RepID=UPI0033FA8A4B